MPNVKFIFLQVLRTWFWFLPLLLIPIPGWAETSAPGGGPLIIFIGSIIIFFGLAIPIGRRREGRPQPLGGRPRTLPMFGMKFWEITLLFGLSLPLSYGLLWCFFWLMFL